MSMPPSAASASSTADRTAISSAMSARKPRAWPGNSASNASRSAALRTVPATASPRSSAASAKARPSPPETPVISQLVMGEGPSSFKPSTSLSSPRPAKRSRPGSAFAAGAEEIPDLRRFAAPSGMTPKGRASRPPSVRLVAAHPEAVHLANVLGVVEEGAGVQRAAIVPHQDIADLPFVAIDEAVLGGEVDQLLHQF